MRGKCCESTYRKKHRKPKAMSREELSEAEKKLFQGLEKERTPPSSLEKKIVAELLNKGEIKKINVMNNYVKLAASIAALVLFFFGGIYYGKATAGTGVQIEPTKGYILLLHEDEGFNPGDPMAMFEEYKTWMENTYGRGVKIDGQELKNEATLVTSEKQTALLESEVNRTTGYFILEANSYEEAVAVAMENPHVKYGGTVEVKPFMVR